jgi:membrane fusion protein (multidrug efflux system)
VQIAQLHSVVNTKRSSELTVNEVKSRIGLNDAEIKRVESALEMAKLNLSYTVITAPHDGIMGRRSVNVGQLLNPSQQVATIVDINNVWITANYRENQMENVKIGGLAKVTVDALGGKEFEGKITAISGATGARYSAVPVDNSTGNFVKVQQRIPVRIEFTDKNKIEDLKQLRAGMNVQVTIN